MRVLGLVAALALSIPLAATAAQGEFQDCEACPVMVEVPPGSFARAHNLDEPAYGVAIGYAFAIGRFEVTVGEFREFAQETGFESGGCQLFRTVGFENYPQGGWEDPGFRQRDTRPVVCVSWDDAQAYAAWISHKTGATYRLPSEAEWEYAARAGTGLTSQWFRRGNLEAGGAKCATCFGGDVMGREDELPTASVGGVPLNPFGLSDLLGNAAEWTLDCANPSFASAPADGRPWLEGDCRRRIVRGGTFHSEWGELARFRLAQDRTLATNDVGFRLAKELRRAADSPRSQGLATPDINDEQAGVTL